MEFGTNGGNKNNNNENNIFIGNAYRKSARIRRVRG